VGSIVGGIKADKGVAIFPKDLPLI